MALLGLSGCGGGSSGGGGAYKGQLAVSHLSSNIVGAPFYIAVDKGFFADEKVQIELVETKGGSAPVRAIVQSTNLGAPSTPAALTGAGKGLSDLRIVSGLFNTPAHVIYIAPKDRKVSQDNLRGKKIGTSSPDSLTTYFAHVIAKELGLTIGGKGEDADIEDVFVGDTAGAWTAAKQGLVDVAWSAPPFATKLLEKGEAKVVLDAEHFKPSFVTICMATTQSFIDSNGHAVEGTLKGLAKAIELMDKDPKQAAASWAKKIKISPSVAEAAVKEYAWSFGLGIDRAGLGQALKAAVQQRQIDPDEKPDIDSLIVDRFIPADSRVRGHHPS